MRGPEIEQQFVATTHQPDIFSEDAIDDVRLRLIFTCCHPALPQEARLALTLREVCGLTTEAIAHAFLVAPSTLAPVEATNWRRIVSLYDVLLALDPSPIVELNRAVAVGMRDGSQAGLDAIESILDSGHLSEYHFTHAARADFCRRLGRTEEARAAYERALALVRQGPERRFLEKRMAEL